MTAVFVYRNPGGGLVRRRRPLTDIPRPGETISEKQKRITFNDLTVPSAQAIKRTVEDLLDRVVMEDSKVTRREDQLDQLCNMLLLKLHSDKKAKLKSTDPPMFRPLESVARTAEEMRREFKAFVAIYPDTFSTAEDKELRLSDQTIYSCVERLAPYRLIDVGVSTIALGFQVLRAAALRQGEGQYFTPQPIIAAGIQLLKIDYDDLVIDPACGTGGFLVESLLQMQRRYPGQEAELSKWAQTNLYGIDKDRIGVKLTKAIMQIAGDGSAHCVRGDSVRTHLWNTEYSHLNQSAFADGRFSVVVTNPPFGRNLKISATDARLAGLDIANQAGGEYRDLEIGLHFLQRAHQLLRMNGRVGIVLPETYFFSPQYQFLLDWIKPRLRPLVVANIPMEAFQGFCRAKTNFYVFRKIE
jgi:type I restriction enzyme M protein